MNAYHIRFWDNYINHYDYNNGNQINGYKMTIECQFITHFYLSSYNKISINIYIKICNKIYFDIKGVFVKGDTHTCMNKKNICYI